MSMQDHPVIPFIGARSEFQRDIPSPANRQEPPGRLSLELDIEDHGPRVQQFACHLILRNRTPNPIDILAINGRLGSGVSMEKSENSSFLDLKEEYETLKKDVQVILRAMYLTKSKDFRTEYSKQVLEGLRGSLASVNPILGFFYATVFRFKTQARMMNQSLQQMDFPVTSADSTRKMLDGLIEKNVNTTAVNDVLLAKIDRMEAIEQIDQNFLRPEYVAKVLPGDDFERIYLLKADRKFSSIASYTAAFDVKLSWEDDSAKDSSHIERIMSRSMTFSVSPNIATLSAVAIAFSILGALLSGLPELKDSYGILLNVDFVKKYFVAGVLAVVLYNSLALSELNERMRSFNWRSAMFVGIACGLLSDKILKAITSFVQ